MKFIPGKLYRLIEFMPFHTNLNGGEYLNAGTILMFVETKEVYNRCQKEVTVHWFLTAPNRKVFLMAHDPVDIAHHPFIEKVEL